jgi:hypothetical protein
MLILIVLNNMSNDFNFFVKFNIYDLHDINFQSNDGFRKIVFVKALLSSIITQMLHRCYLINIRLKDSL